MKKLPTPPTVPKQLESLPQDRAAAGGERAGAGQIVGRGWPGGVGVAVSAADDGR